MHVIVWSRSTKWEYNADLGAGPPPKPGVASSIVQKLPKTVRLRAVWTRSGAVLETTFVVFV